MGKLEGKQILFVVGQKNYDEKEFNVLFTHLEAEGADVFIASPEMQKALGRLNGYVTPDLTIAEASAKDYDAIVLVGGYGARVYLWDDQATHRLLQEAHENHKVIAAASTAPVALANAGILQGRRATVFPDYVSNLTFQQNKIELVHDPIVVDDNIITSSHHRVAKQLAEAIIEKLSSS